MPYIVALFDNADATIFDDVPMRIRIDSLVSNGIESLPIWASCLPDGSDIRIISGDGATAIPFWIEHFDYANQIAVIWVRASVAVEARISLRLYWAIPGLPGLSNYDAVFGTASASITGLLALYHCDDGSGASLANAANPGVSTGIIHGTTSAVWFGADGGNWRYQSPVQPFTNGDRLSLNGSDNYLEFPNIWNASGPIGFSFWVKFSFATQYALIFYKQTDGGIFEVTWNSASSRFGIRWFGSVIHDITGEHPVASGQWVHVAGGMDSGIMRLYVNGEVDAVLLSTGTNFVGGGSSSLFVGHDSRGFTPPGLFAGEMDELLLFSRLPAEWEIKALFARRPLVKVAGPYDRVVLPNITTPLISNADGHSRLEPSVIRDAENDWKLWCHDLNTVRTEYYTSTAGDAGWRRQSDDVFGVDTVGTSVRKIGSTYHATFGSNYSNPSTHLQHWTSPDATTWTQQANAITATSDQAFCNASFVVRADGMLCVLAEYYDRLASLYTVGLWTGTDWGSLVFRGLVSGLYYGGGPDLHEFDGRLYLLSHGSRLSGANNIPCVTSGSVSVDGLHWQDAGTNPAIQLQNTQTPDSDHGVYGQDQVADPCAVQSGSDLYLYQVWSHDGSVDGFGFGPFGIFLVKVPSNTISRFLTDNLTADLSISENMQPPTTIATGVTDDGRGQVQSSVVFTFKLLIPPSNFAGISFSSNFFSATSDGSGNISVQLLQSATYLVRRGNKANFIKFSTPATSSCQFPELIGDD